MSGGSGHFAPLGGRLFTRTFAIASVLFLVAAVVLAQRFAGGLGAVANINDGYPWGMWVVVDVVIGTAFGCAGYVMALLVYILNRGHYDPLVRPALLAGLFGYTLAGVAVIIDLGRWWQFYNLLNPELMHGDSVMLEVGLCVLAYTVILWLEFAPAILERLGLRRAERIFDRGMFLLVALGVLLPTMHQSSLGTLLVVLGHQISPLWQSQLLPVLFLVSAILMGFATVVGEAVLASTGFRRPLERDLLGRVSRVMAYVALVWLVLRVVDLSVRGAFPLAFDGTVQAGMFWVEMTLHVVPLLLLASPAKRNQPPVLFASAALLLAGGIVYRINAYLVGYDPAGGTWAYFPSVPELLVTLGIFGLEVALYLLFVKKLPVLHRPEAHQA